MLKVSLLICFLGNHFSLIVFFLSSFLVVFFSLSCVSNFIYIVELACFLQAQIASAMLGHA